MARLYTSRADDHEVRGYCEYKEHKGARYVSRMRLEDGGELVRVCRHCREEVLNPTIYECKHCGVQVVSAVDTSGKYREHKLDCPRHPSKVVVPIKKADRK